MVIIVENNDIWDSDVLFRRRHIPVQKLVSRSLNLFLSLNI